MVMRYHWGFAVGHIDSHGQSAGRARTPVTSNDYEDGPELETASSRHARPNAEIDVNDDGQLELDFGNRDDDDWEDIEYLSDVSDEHGAEDLSDDDMLVAMDDMYGAGFYEPY
jgi:hypothetical protein